MCGKKIQIIYGHTLLFRNKQQHIMENFTQALLLLAIYAAAATSAQEIRALSNATLSSATASTLQFDSFQYVQMLTCNHAQTCVRIYRYAHRCPGLRTK